MQMLPTELGQDEQVGGRPMGFIVINLPINLKDKLFRTVVRPTLLYGSEFWGGQEESGIKRWS